MIPQFVTEDIINADGVSTPYVLFDGRYPNHRRPPKLNDFESQAEKYSQYSAIVLNLYDSGKVRDLHETTNISLYCDRFAYPDADRMNADRYTLKTDAGRLVFALWFADLTPETHLRDIDGAVVASSEKVATTIMVALRLFAT